MYSPHSCLQNLVRRLKTAWDFHHPWRYIYDKLIGDTVCWVFMPSYRSGVSSGTCEVALGKKSGSRIVS